MDDEHRTSLIECLYSSFEWIQVCVYVSEWKTPPMKETQLIKYSQFTLKMRMKMNTNVHPCYRAHWVLKCIVASIALFISCFFLFFLFFLIFIYVWILIAFDLNIFAVCSCSFHWYESWYSPCAANNNQIQLIYV